MFQLKRATATAQEPKQAGKPWSVPWKPIFIALGASAGILLLALVFWPGRYTLIQYGDGLARMDRFTGHTQFWRSGDSWQDIWPSRFDN